MLTYRTLGREDSRSMEEKLGGLMQETDVSDAKQRVLDTAEMLFMQRGYNAITLRDIAEELGIRQASLYYHFPRGKEQLYVEVAQRAFERHRQGMVRALAEAGPDFARQLQAVADWFATQPEMNLGSMMHSDMPALSEEQARYLGQVAYDCLFEPLHNAFIAAHERGEIRYINPNVLTGSFLAILDGMSYSTRSMDRPSREEMIADVISVLLDGLRIHPAAAERCSTEADSAHASSGAALDATTK